MKARNAQPEDAAFPMSSAAAHNSAMSLSMPTVVADLVDLLGATSVATIGGVQETRAVHQWIAGEREPQRPHVLRFALQLATMISTVGTRDLARAWFYGANPGLDDKTPLVLLRDEPLEQIQARLMTAARSFAGRDAK
jgi:hypothetical protein